MFITKVAPLTKIPRPAPQILSYFTAQKLERGALVLVPLRKKKIKAIVFSQRKVSEVKMEIKKADFELKPILKILEKNPVITQNQIELAKWLADYYWASFGKTLSLFVKKGLENKKQSICENGSFLKKLIIAPNNFCPTKEIKKALFYKKEVLFLVPEKTKEAYWKKELKELKSEKLIIGTRSKLFYPFSNLGLIIVTKEGNKNYKSQMEPKYNAINVAEALAKIWKAKLIIISSFPSIETQYKTNKVEYITQKDKEQIKKEIIDIRKIKPWKPISEPLLSSIKENVKNNGKTLLFLNRRGAATTLLCQDCGWIQKCKDCDLPLTYHLENESPKMVCHYCAKKYETPHLCKNCNSWNLKTLGVGIQKIEKELKSIFGKEKVFCLDSKIAKTKKDQEKIIENFLAPGPSILITTSLFLKFPIFEKFPLVAVVSLDSLLCQPDFKIEEEVARKIDTLLFLTKEKFILQTFFPQSKAISWIKKEKIFFYQKALEERKSFSYPPFSTIIKLSMSDKKREKIINEGFKLKEKIKTILEKYKIKTAKILGPSPDFIEKIKGKYRWKLIIKLQENKSKKEENKKIKNFILSQIPSTWKIDIDPERVI